MGEAPCFAHFLDGDGRMPEPGGVKVRRVYERAGPRRETTVLVDRLWPRGLRRDELKIDRWARDLAPSDELRRWFGHDPGRWDGFRRRYRVELAGKTQQLRELAELACDGPLVLLYSARDPDHNQAVVLKEVLEEGMTRTAARPL